MKATKPRILLIDDDISAPSPSQFSCRVLDKIRKCTTAAGCDIAIPDCKALALAAPKPNLLLLDIDLSGWGRKFQGFEFWESATRFRNIPLIVLSAEPRLATNFFAQKGAKVVWWPKERFLEAKDDFLAHQFLSMASDIDNARLDLVLDTDLIRLKVMEGAVSIAEIPLEDPQMPISAPFSSDMSNGQIRFHLVRMLIQKGQIESSLLKPAFSKREDNAVAQQRFLANFNEDIRQRTQGRIGYKLIVNEARDLKLKARTNPSTNYPGRLQNAPATGIPINDVARIEALIQRLDERLSQLENGGNTRSPSGKARPKQ